MGPRLAVFTKNLVNPAYGAARLGAERVAQRFRGSVEHYVPDIPDDVAQQIALIDRAMSGETLGSGGSSPRRSSMPSPGLPAGRSASHDPRPHRRLRRPAARW